MLYEKLTEDYKIAMKEKQETKKSALNFVLAQIKNKKIELQRDPNDDEIIALLKKEVKSLNEALSFLEKADKPAELAEEQEKKAILESYLPAMLDKETTKKLIESLVSELQIADLKTGRGLLMKELMAKHKSELDGSLVNQIINEML
jgi:gatB/yqey domain protein